MNRLYQIISPYFVAGFEYGFEGGENRVVHVAPIIKYMRGWSLTEVADYCVKRHWRLLFIPT